ncbi:nitrite/sulfite reductase domain-containing protein [Methanofollis fontis]|uniref:Sulfite reductase, assimilatory-type n=1 Tax=Methanofollis fontis TaxID=2052832 RepID=A0A483CKE6_9EURY|nr:NAD(P)/FAD-dependent oxidoreductase [Methanofollis fontis]TAJ43341.1 sulfite reductase, assimilatory-type [Methanofollis fontis]
MQEGPRGAILQRDKQTYAIVPRTPAGIVTPEVLETIAKVARRYEIPVIKITSGQRMALVGIKPEDVDPIWNELGMTVGEATAPCVHYVQACPGTAVCKYGVQDSLGFGLRIEEDYQAMNLPAKLKMGVSGCPRCCGESYMRDVGVIGTAKGWTVTFGGNSGGRPRIGDVIGRDLTTEDALSLVRLLLEFYRDSGKPGERTPRMVERLGIEAVKEAIGGKGP